MKYCVFGVRLVRLPVKVPVPDPLLVLLSAIVGLVVVLQQTPLAVTGAPPSSVILPPLVAVTAVIADAAVVVIDATPSRVVKLTSFPYPVPALFVA
jgi:hypothetical protein